MKTEWKDVAKLYVGIEVKTESGGILKMTGVHIDDFSGTNEAVVLNGNVTHTTRFDGIKPILRPLSDMTNKEINEICSIAMDREIECFEINWTEEKDFVSAYWKRDYNNSPSEKWQYVSYGIWISENLNVEFKWIYRYHNGDGVDDQNLPNHHHITAYLLSKSFDLFGLINSNQAISRTTLTDKK